MDKNNLNNNLGIFINYFNFCIYLFVCFILCLSIIKSIWFYFDELLSNKDHIKSKIILGKNISVALSFILAAEVFKLFYIKDYKDLIIVASITILKIIINIFLHFQINEYEKKLVRLNLNEYK